MEALFSRRNSYNKNNHHTVYKKKVEWYLAAPSRHILVLWHFKEFITDCL